MLRLQIQPQAKKSEVAGEYGERLKIRIAAPPVDGKANEELLSFLKKKLRVRSGDLSLVRGDTSRSKDVLCTALTEDEIRELLKEGK
ncbi:MAG: DUF167 domain-containing protein [Bdellovibrionia bacterium]